MKDWEPTPRQANVLGWVLIVIFCIFLALGAAALNVWIWGMML